MTTSDNTSDETEEITWGKSSVEMPAVTIKDIVAHRVNSGKNTCSCPAGLSGYCNHVMALLFELADYSLNQLFGVPDEIACTSKLRQRGNPGKPSNAKEPVIYLTIHKQYDKKGISCTLYDPRINDSRQNAASRFQDLALKLKENDSRRGFANCSDSTQTVMKNTKYGEFVIGSSLSFHLAPTESNNNL